MDPLDSDPNFEPQTRARSNTWPLPRPDNYVDPGADDEKVLSSMQGGHIPPGGGVVDAPKKNSSRRNAWGNMSYADLITQAIQSSPENRLTLAQIYEWMVQNVAYFKDKGDSNSSAGWKNSIRHNLSLHNRFMRVQNEGTGKSSWWMINPDAKPGKAARRRATSMETQKYEKKRGRVKKKVEALRNGATPSPSSSVQSEGQDLFPESPPVHHGFQLSPDFRPRASSNASSCGGRLSPIPAVESDMHESDMPPLSPIPWNGELPHLTYDATVAAGGAMDRNSAVQPSLQRTHADGWDVVEFTTDHLVKTLTESMKLRNGSGGDPDGSFSRLTDCAVKPVSSSRPSQQQLGSGGGYTLGYTPQYGSNGNGVRTATEYRPPSYQQQPSPDPMGAVVKRPSPPQQQQQQVIETVNGRSYTLTRLQSIGNHLQQQQQQQQHPIPPAPQQLDGMQSYRQQLPSFMDSVDPLLRTSNNPQQPMYSTKDIKEERLSPLLAAACNAHSAPAPSYHQHMMGQQQQAALGHLLYNPFPQDLDFEPVGLECDVDQVIRHELSVDGNLDFNFDPSQVNGSAATSNSAAGHHAAITSSTRSWVH